MILLSLRPPAPGLAPSLSSRCRFRIAPLCWVSTLVLRPALFPMRRRYASSTTIPTVVSDAPAPDLKHTRNIGIIAHIDAGKTTTTERMLFYSGFTRRIGDVDEGSTVMDYLPAERARGITITSACITFPWHNNTINLIDTPGHADFTFEVERSIRVLDGAVTILDGVAGVEAQTEMVWRQAGRYGIPRIVFINKLDRMGAGFGRTVREVGIKLGGWPAVCQIPIYETDTQSEEVFKGVVDVIEKRVFRWGETGDVGDGRTVDVHDYTWLEGERPELFKEAEKARVALVELLSEFDEGLVETFLELGDHRLISAADIKKAIRKQVLDGKGRIIPIFCGASFRNVGVQPLLDGVIDYLPSPIDRPKVEVSYAGESEKALLDVSDDKLCALAFKVINDPRRGAMVFVRVYSGTLNRGAFLYNTNLQNKERATRLLRMYADDAVEIPTISTGHIGVILGLKHARTGDTLIATDAKPINPHVQINTAHKKEKKDKKDKKASKSTTKVHRDENSLQLRPIDVPPPVFFASIEPSSLSEQKHLEEALTMLLREDPSLHVSIDEDTGQTLLSGMGELHLEIARDRLVGDLKAKAEMGKILIAYRETVTGPLSQPIRKTYERDIGGKRLAAAISASLGSTETPPKHLTTTESIPLDSNNLLTISILHSPGSDIDENHSLPAHLHPYSMLLTSLISGTTAALSRGPFLGFPCHSTHVHLTLNPMTDIFSPAESTFPAFTAATRLAVSTALRNAQEESTTQHHDRISLMEPVMNVAINVDESDLGVVVSDISGTRGGNVISLDDDNEETPDLASSPPNPNSAPLQNQTTLTIDPAKIYSPPDTSISPSSTGTADTHHRPRTIRAKVPLNEMVGYLRHLRSLTKGRGTFVMSVDKFEKMTGNRIRGVVGEMRGAEV